MGDVGLLVAGVAGGDAALANGLNGLAMMDRCYANSVIVDWMWFLAVFLLPIAAALPAPSPRQLRLLDRQLTQFMHFSLCTFSGCQWDRDLQSDEPQRLAMGGGRAELGRTGDMPNGKTR